MKLTLLERRDSLIADLFVVWFVEFIVDVLIFMIGVGNIDGFIFEGVEDGVSSLEKLAHFRVNSLVIFTKQFLVIVTIDGVFVD